MSVHGRRSSTVKRAIKFRIGKRRGWRCRYCGTTLSKESATLEHKLPLSMGGGYHESNLALSCRSCNKEKGDMTDEEYIQFRIEKAVRDNQNATKERKEGVFIYG